MHVPDFRKTCGVKSHQIAKRTTMPRQNGKGRKVFAHTRQIQWTNRIVKWNNVLINYPLLRFTSSHYKYDQKVVGTSQLENLWMFILNEKKLSILCAWAQQKLKIINQPNIISRWCRSVHRKVEMANDTPKIGLHYHQYV